MRARTAALVLSGLAVVHTWPLASNPAGLSLHYNNDAELCAWILAWIAQTLPTDPLNLFNAPIFAPERGTLAYSEPTIVPALLGAPAWWLTRSAVLTFNLVQLAGLTLTALAGWWVARRWTGSPGAALVAGALIAFNVHTLTRLPHTVATHLWGLPLALYLADGLVDSGNATPQSRRTKGLALALVVAALAVTSAYWLVLGGVIVAIVITSGALTGRWRGAVSAALWSAGGLLLASPVLVPYAMFAAGGSTRPIEVVAQFTATPAGYLASMSRLHAGWSAPFFRDEVNLWFAGVGALVLALAGLAALVAHPATRRRAAVLVAIGATGVFLSFGPDTRLYVWLFEHVPPLQGLRATARFGYLFLMVVGLLAAHGVAWLVARRPAPAGALIATAALAIVTIESVHAPIRTMPFDGVPAIYGLVGDIEPPMSLVEVPFWPPEVVHENGEYVLNQTAHWRPLMNGMSGFTPLSYRTRTETFWYFPRPGVVEAMAAEGATHVMVHLERFDGRERAEIVENLSGRRDLWLLATDGQHQLYEIRR